jgi:uncharacterized membrane protein YoaK (UPF0700 family)
MCDMTFPKEEGALVLSTPNSIASSESLRPSPAEILSTFFYSCSGGFADASGFLIAGSFAGHITGNLVLLSISGASENWVAMSRPLTAIIAFLLATEIGIMSAKHCPGDLKWVVFIAQCAIISGLGVNVIRHSPWFDLAVVIAFSLCLGLQNGVVSSVDGVVVHSSYMTGTATRVLKSLSTLSVSGTPLQAPSTLATITISGAVIAGFLTGTIGAVVAKVAVASYSPLFLCLPLFAAAISSSQRWQVHRQPKRTS